MTNKRDNKVAKKRDNKVAKKRDNVTKRDEEMTHKTDKSMAANETTRQIIDMKETTEGGNQPPVKCTVFTE